MIEFEYNDLNEEYHYNKYPWDICIARFGTNRTVINNKFGWLIVDDFHTPEQAMAFCQRVIDLQENMYKETTDE